MFLRVGLAGTFLFMVDLGLGRLFVFGMCLTEQRLLWS